MKQVFAKLLICAVVLGFGVGNAYASQFLADRHVAHGVPCSACHGKATPVKGSTVDQKACLACHKSLDNVAKMSEKKGVDPNPHYNHLVGLNCLECHQGHKEGKNLCGTCHALHYKVP